MTDDAPAITHDCPQYDALNPTELADLPPWFYLHGGAIASAMHYHRAAHRWRIDNGEYASAIAFCPYCGLDLLTLVLVEER